MSKMSQIPTSLLDTSSFKDEGLRILFVEDSESDYELMCYRLKANGMQASTGRVDELQALKHALEHEQWDVVISDHRLPGFSSEEALQVVRDSGLGLPFIIVSGNIGEDVAVEAMRAGADDYLMKDKMARLVPAVERSLRAAQERRNLQVAEKAQRESERQLAAITENIPGLVLQMQSSQSASKPRLLFASEGVLHLFGLPVRQFLEKAEVFFDQFHPEDAADLLEAIAEQTPIGGNLNWEGRIKPRGNQDTRWVLLNALGKPSQDVVIWDGVLLDISDRKKAEQDLQASKEELRKVTSEFEKRRENERAAIAREIHDDMGGSLTKLKADIAKLEQTHGTDEATAERLDDMLELVEHLLASSQRIAKDLRPGILDYGLVPALEWQMKDFTKRCQIASDFKCNADHVDMDPERSTALFRVLQECLTNIVKHAGATKVNVELFASEAEVTLEVIDNGKGIENADRLKQTSFGLRGMQERLAAFGGWIDISGSPGAGTTLMAFMPLEQTEKENDDD